MKKLLILLPVVFFTLTGCTESKFTEEESITKYTLNNYSERLLDANVKFLKCFPETDGTMRSVYTTVQRDNSFPAVIRLDYLNQSYNVYFDKSYLNIKKETLINDIDACMESWQDLKDAKQTWR